MILKCHNLIFCSSIFIFIIMIHNFLLIKEPSFFMLLLMDECCNCCIILHKINDLLHFFIKIQIIILMLILMNHDNFYYILMDLWKNHHLFHIIENIFEFFDNFIHFHIECKLIHLYLIKIYFKYSRKFAFIIKKCKNLNIYFKVIFIIKL